MDREIEFLASDNDNVFNSDPNPYAFPYFHVNEIPALYKSVIAFLSLCNNHNLSPRAKSLLLHKSAKKIINRCQSFPKESGWVDSCGENALMQICQLVRFHRHNSVHFPTIHTTNTSTNTSTSTSTSANTNQQRHRQEQEQNELIIDIAAALIKAEPRASFTVNNWNETPLHQFLGHCGWEQKQTSNASEGAQHSHPMQLQNDPDDHLDNFPSHDRDFSILFLETLIYSNPQSVFIENYEEALPLHEVCTLSHMGNFSIPHMSFPYSSLTIDRTIQSNECHHSLEEQSMAQRHVQIIQVVAAIYPKGFLRLDLKKRSPLYRAVESMHCSVEVVIHILKEMEKLFSSKGHLVEVDFDDVMIPRLMRRAILGLKEKSSQVDAHHGEGDVSAMQPMCKIASPLEGLWVAILLPRQKPTTWNNNVRDTTICSDSNTMSFSALMATSASSQSKARDMANKMGSIWKKVMVLMCSSYHGSMKFIVGNDNSQWLPLHAAISTSAPMGVIQLLSKLYPDELFRLHHVRDQGVTPITFALARIKHLKKAWDKEDSDNEKEDRSFLRETIRALLGNDGSMASKPNSQGRLPLHIAIENGLGWNEGTAVIYRAYPAAVSVRDPVTGLFPFLAAAAQGTHHGSIISLGCCHLLLKADPSVLVVSCHPCHEIS
jgi:hypothetical protein